MKPRPCPADAFSLQIVNSFWGEVARRRAHHACRADCSPSCHLRNKPADLQPVFSLPVSTEAQRIGKCHGLQDRRGDLFVGQPECLALAA